MPETKEEQRKAPEGLDKKFDMEHVEKIDLSGFEIVERRPRKTKKAR